MSKALISNANLSFLSFFLPDATWIAKYHEWRGSIAPPFYSQEVRSGLWTLASSWWKTQQSQSTASRSKMLTSMMKGPMSAQSWQTRNQNPQKCISLFKVRPLQSVSDCIQPQQITKGYNRISVETVLCVGFLQIYRWTIVNLSCSMSGFGQGESTVKSNEKSLLRCFRTVWLDGIQWELVVAMKPASNLDLISKCW